MFMFSGMIRYIVYNSDCESKFVCLCDSDVITCKVIQLVFLNTEVINNSHKL